MEKKENNTMNMKSEKISDFGHKHGKCIGIMHYTAPPTEIGGVEMVISAHVRFLSRKGYKVHLIFGSGGRFKDISIVEHKVDILSPNSDRVLAVQGQIVNEGRETEAFKELKMKLKARLKAILSDLDTCIVHNIPSMPFNFAASAAINELVNELDTSFIYWIHDIAHLRPEWSERIDRFPMTILLPKNTRITYVTVSNFRAQQLEQLTPHYELGKIHVIPNGVDVEDYQKMDKNTIGLMHKLGVAFQDLVMLIPVRVTPRKNIELALSVAEELKHLLGDGRSIKVLITGPPDHQAVSMGMRYLEYLNTIVKRRGLQDNVIFCHELISHQRVFENKRVVKWSVGDVYTIADFVFVPSREEGFGLPVIEAGVARKMVFCARIPPFQELLREGIDGYMFDLHDDPKNIAFRIYKEFVLDVVDSNFNNVVRKFSWDTILSKKLVPLL
jgi:glycosyltransferase involved in cell wall biosynthesis